LAVVGKCSPASAQRDIADLVEKRRLKRNPGGGKDTSYDLA
jgi:DeoR/GlpR family transcriptional regulator of sugar metabolism